MADNSKQSCDPSSKTSLFVRDLTEKLQRSYPVSLQRGAISINDATGDVDVIREYCASTQESIEMAVASFREVWELGFKAAAAIRPDETNGWQGVEKLAEQRNTAYREIENLRAALVYSCHAQHATPLHMLPDGITLYNDDGVKVERAGYRVYAGPSGLREAKALGHSPEEPECQHDWVTAIAAPNMGRCKKCGAKMPSEKARAPIDLNLEPIGKCDKCGRKVWKEDVIGKRDEMTQPNGGQCGGAFVYL